MLRFLPPPAKTYPVTALSKRVWPEDAQRSSSFFKAARSLNIEVAEDSLLGYMVNEDGAAAFLALVPDRQQTMSMIGGARERAMGYGMRVGLGIEDGEYDKELYKLTQDTSLSVEEYNRLVIARFQQMRVEGGLVEEIVSASESDGGTPSWANMRGQAMPEYGGGEVTAAPPAPSAQAAPPVPQEAPQDTAALGGPAPAPSAQAAPPVPQEAPQDTAAPAPSAQAAPPVPQEAPQDTAALGGAAPAPSAHPHPKVFKGPISSARRTTDDWGDIELNEMAAPATTSQLNYAYGLALQGQRIIVADPAPNDHTRPAWTCPLSSCARKLRSPSDLLRHLKTGHAGPGVSVAIFAVCLQNDKSGQRAVYVSDKCGVIGEDRVSPLASQSMHSAILNAARHSPPARKRSRHSSDPSASASASAPATATAKQGYAYIRKELASQKRMWAEQKVINQEQRIHNNQTDKMMMVLAKHDKASEERARASDAMIATLVRRLPAQPEP